MEVAELVTSVRDAITVSRVSAEPYETAADASRRHAQQRPATHLIGLDVGLVDRLTVGRSTPAAPPHDHAAGDDSTVGSSEGLSNRAPADRLLNEAHP